MHSQPSSDRGDRNVASTGYVLSQPTIPRSRQTRREDRWAARPSTSSQTSSRRHLRRPAPRQRPRRVHMNPGKSWSAKNINFTLRPDDVCHLAALLLRAALRGSGIVARALLRAGLFASFSLAKGKKIVSHGMQQTTDDAAAKGQHKPMHKPHSHTLTLGDGYGFKCGGGERSVWS